MSYQAYYARLLTPKSIGFACSLFVCIGLAAVRCAAADATSVARHPLPSFVIINCDNLGYGDIGCFGSKKHRTPHLSAARQYARR